MMTEEWDKYYATTYDGEIVCEGSYKECEEMVLRALDDDCAEMWFVTANARKVVL